MNSDRFRRYWKRVKPHLSFYGDDFIDLAWGPSVSESSELYMKSILNSNKFNSNKQQNQNQ